MVFIAAVNSWLLLFLNKTFAQHPSEPLPLVKCHCWNVVVKCFYKSKNKKNDENETFCRNCGTCVTDPHCGFCFDKTSQHNATCLPLPKEIHLQEFGLQQDLSHFNFSSTSGDFECGNNTADNGWELITKFCPTKYAWMSTFGLIIYLAFFAPGIVLLLS